MTDRELLELLVTKIDNLDNRFNVLEDKVNTLEDKVADVQLTLENVTNRNISIIAEGHQDILRHFNEITKVESDKEMMKVRLNIVERDVERLKKKLVETA